MTGQRLMGRLVALVGIGAASISSMAAAPPAGASVEQNARRQVVQMLDRMPLLFVPEKVSPDGAMGYAVRGSEASVWLSATGLSYRLNPHAGSDPATGAGSWVVALDLVGATPRQPAGEEPLPTTVSYFKGPKDQWRTGLPSFGSVRYSEPWPGVDVLVSGTAGELESTFVVRPGADPGQIRLAYRGATAVRLEPDGSLVVDTPLGSITERPPIAYQLVDGRRTHVAAAFELEGGSDSGRKAYRFRLGDYDPERELVVDPVTLVYCGYIGGSGGEYGRGIAVDAVGRAYVTGVTESTEATFPVTVGPDLTFNGSSVYAGDAFVAKVSSPDLIFADGFESGDTGQWSAVVPGGEPSPPGETCGPGDSLAPTDTLPWSGSLDPNSQDFTLGGPGCDTQIGDDVVVCFTSSNDCMIDAACSVGSGSHSFNLFEGECTTALTACVANIGLLDFEVTAGQTYCIVCSASDPGPVTVFLQVAPGGNACHFIIPA